MNRLYTNFFCSLLVICTSQFSYSQDRCGFDELHKASLLNDPVYKANFDSSQKRLATFIAKKALIANIPLAPVYRIPVVVHVIHKGEAIGTGTNISDVQIQSAITSLNQFYRNAFGPSNDVEVEFELAKLSPSCLSTTAINRVDGTVIADYATNGITIAPFATTNQAAVKALSTWTNRDYYNIWIVSEINDNNAGAGIQGFATFPTPSVLDGAVIMYNAFGYDPGGALGYNLKSYTRLNKTTVHELGHAFSLYHSFQGDDSDNNGVADMCPVNATCATQGDQVCDTDPHQRSLSNCPVASTNTCTGGSLDPIAHNFMDYSSEACQDRFTVGQIARMRASIELSRATLLTSRALNTTYPITPYAPPVAACASTTSATGLSGDYTGIMNIGIASQNFGSLTPRLDNITSGYVNWTPDCHKLNELIRGGTYTFSATVYAFNQEQVRAWIDYNNNGVFDNATEQIYINTTIPSHPTDYVTVSGNFTVPATATVNTVLRMRVIGELSTVHGAPAISGGCYNSIYGQAEDFHIYLNSTLPIVLESFTGKRNGADVILNWQSSLEQNAKEYQVEKSNDGVSFSKIGVVSASRNSNSARHYSFTDKTISQENNYYRLRLVDMDGQSELSKVVLIKIPLTGKAPFNLLSNPVQNNLDIQFGDVPGGKVQVRLTDITGKVMMTWIGEQVANSRVRIDVKDSNLSKGVYILHARIQGKDYVEKVIIK